MIVLLTTSALFPVARLRTSDGLEETENYRTKRDKKETKGDKIKVPASMQGTRFHARYPLPCKIPASMQDTRSTLDNVNTV
jgi:hypothetical protein